MRIALVVPTSWFTSATCGGAEKQVYYIASAMAKASHTVDLYTMDIDKPFCREGVSILPAWNPNTGIRKLRYFSHRIPELKNKLISGNYDIIYFRGESFFSSSLIPILCKTRAITVLGLAHDSNVSWKIWKKKYLKKSQKREWVKYLIIKYYFSQAVKKVDVVLTQNTVQSKFAKMLSSNVKYCPNIYRPQQFIFKPDIKKSDIIWIGSLRNKKGIEHLFEIVSLLPNIEFLVIGKTTGKRQVTFEKMFAQHLNVTYIPHIPNSEIHLYLQASKLLLNTSPSEGFSNTFLEAWHSKLPVVALHVNPSNLLTRFGYCANGNLNLLLESIKQLLLNKTKRISIGEKAKEYVLNEHNEKKIVKLFENSVK